MLNIEKNKNGTDFAIALEGRLDTTTAPQLEKELKEDVNGVSELTFDFAKLEYISSAGLRVLLSAQKIMNKQGHMVIRNVNDDIMEIFEVTGFSDILDIE
jgi:anti-sigma B factor antagonist